jgi:cobalt-zinc-cadmium efflux system membrane fusion protein
MKRPTLLALCVVFASAACNRSPQKSGVPAESKPDPGAPEGHEHEELPKKVRLAARVITEAKVKSAPVVKEVIATTVTLPGEIAADPDKSARLSSPVAGRIEKVSFKEGSLVKKGDVLATIRVPELGRVRSAYASSSAKARAARTNADRLKALVDQRLAASQTYLDAKADADAYEAEASALSEQLAAMGTGTSGSFSLALRAPIAGAVVSRDAIVGQPVTTEQTLASIADLSEVWFLARVFEKDLGRLQVGAQAEVQLNAHPDERFQGSIEYLGKQIDPQARTVTARIRLTNRAELLRIGLFGAARVHVHTDAQRDAVLVVPRSALTEIAGKPVVFVQHGDNEFELHELVLGEAGVGRVEVLSGLREGEQVVIEGTFTLKSAVLRKSLTEDE